MNYKFNGIVMHFKLNNTLFSINYYANCVEYEVLTCSKLFSSINLNILKF